MPQKQANADATPKADERLTTVKRIAFFIKLAMVIVVLALGAILAYTLLPRITPSSPYNSDMEKLLEARKSTNPQSCNTIEDSEVKETCIMNVAENTMDSKVCSRITGKNIYDVCLYRVAKKTKDGKICEQIENANIKAECNNALI